MTVKYYLPFIYFFNTRAKTIIHRASFFILIVFPIFYFIFSMNGNAININVILVSILGFIGMFSIYEIGYIYNDVYTTRFEEHPSYWMNKEDRCYIDERFSNLIAIRVGYGLTVSLILKYFFRIEIVYYCIALVILYIIYSLHNSIRNRWNILTDCGLQILKYTTVLFLFYYVESFYKYCIAMFFAVPLIRCLEFMGKKRLNIKIFEKIDVSVLRIVYHAVVLFGAIIIFHYWKGCITLVVSSLVLLIYRIASLFLLKNEKVYEIRQKNFEKVE